MIKVRWIAAAGLCWLAAAGCAGAGATGQSQECRDYIACYQKVGTGSVQDYEAGGSCWTGVAALAQSCTTACTSTLMTLKGSYPDAGC